MKENLEQVEIELIKNKLDKAEKSEFTENTKEQILKQSKMRINFDDTNKLLDDIQDIVNRTVWTIELEKRPTKTKQIASRLLFGKNFKCIIKDK